MEKGAWELGGVDWTDKKGRINETCPGIHLWIKKEVARKGDNRPPHIRRVRFTEFQGEDDGQPFKHRHRHLPLFKVKVGRFPMVVKEQFFFRPAGSIPGFDCQSLARSRRRAGASSAMPPCCWRRSRRSWLIVGIMAADMK